MSKPCQLSSVVEGETYFVGSSTHRRGPLFKLPQMANLLIDPLYGYRKQAKFLIHCFVVMPDHFHPLPTPVPGVTLERALQLIKGGFSCGIKKELRMALDVWELGFTDRRVRRGEYDGMRRYIEQNPVEARLVKCAADYPYGSASGKFEVDPVPPRLVTSAAKAVASGGSS